MRSVASRCSAWRAWICAIASRPRPPSSVPTSCATPYTPARRTRLTTRNARSTPSGRYSLSTSTNVTSHAPRSPHCASCRAEYTNNGANHAEGGWPESVNVNDPETTQRYRRKIEKDDGYIHCVMTQSPVSGVTRPRCWGWY